MTVAVALVCEDGALLASDSMGASGELASTVTKVHSCSPFRLAWTWAGTSYLGQQVGRTLSDAAREIDPVEWSKSDPHDSSEQIVKRIRLAVKEAIAPLLPPVDDGVQHEAEFLLAGYSTQPFVVHVHADLSWELETGDHLTAIGSGHAFAAVTRALMHHYIEGGLTLEQAKVVAYRAIDTVCNVSSYGVAVPVQMASVSSDRAMVLGKREVEAIGFSVERWKQLERDTLREGFERQAEAEPLPKLGDNSEGL